MRGKVRRVAPQAWPVLLQWCNGKACAGPVQPELIELAGQSVALAGAEQILLGAQAAVFAATQLAAR